MKILLSIISLGFLVASVVETWNHANYQTGYLLMQGAYMPLCIRELIYG